MLTCEAPGCLSCQDTKVDGREIAFFPLPNDDFQREQWLQNCKLSNIADNDKPLYLCELHFDSTSFAAPNELKPSAVPTVFAKREESLRKRKTEAVLQADSARSPPLKQTKLDDDSHSLVTPPQSPLTQLVDNAKEANNENRTNVYPNHEQILNGSSNSNTELYHELERGKKIFRLTIEIDKVYGKPCPRSKKLVAFMRYMKKNQEFLFNANDVARKDECLQRIGRKSCAKGSCKLRKSFYESKPAYQCEYCDKYYVTKKNDNQDERSKICTICQKTFPNQQSLYLHIKTHLVCDMCQTECSSQVTYDKHTRLHVSTDPLYPYKCHQCTEIFELKEDIRQHYLIIHPTIQLQNTILQTTASPVAPQQSQQKDHRCVSCNITFRNEQAFRNHINSHKKKEDLRCSISETNNVFPVPNPLTGSQIGILRAVKFSCRVCSMEFDNVGEVDKHTRTHLEEEHEEERKCNICMTLFKTSALFNEHLKQHLARAHPCPICSKAFINRTTLEIHLKTHSES